MYTEIAVMTLAAIAQDEGAPSAARVSAAQALLDRGYGRPAQAVAVAGDVQRAGELVFRWLGSGAERPVSEQASELADGTADSPVH